MKDSEPRVLTGPPFTRPNGIAYRTTQNDKVRVWCHACWGMKAPLHKRALVADIDAAYAWWNEHEQTDLHAELQAEKALLNDALNTITRGLDITAGHNG